MIHRLGIEIVFLNKLFQKDYIYGYGQRFESWDEFEEENQLQVYLDDYSD